MQVHATQQGPEGFMWFAGPGGLVRYDGWAMDSYQPKDGLSSAGLRSLSVDARGRLWVGTDVGVDLRERDGRIHPLVEPGSWTGGFVEAIVPGADGDMWIATSSGLFRWSEARQVEEIQEPEVRNRLVSSVVVDHLGTVWVAAPQAGLLRRRGERWERVELPALSAVGRIGSLATTSRHTLLVGGDAGLVELITTEAGFEAHPLLQGESVTAVIESGDELWVGVSRQVRLLRRSDERWSAGETVLSDVLANHLSIDALGDLWVATDNFGVAKISALRGIVHKLETPCASQVFAVTSTPGGSLLVGGDTCSWILERNPGGRTRRLTSLDGVKVWDLLQDPRGSLWAATEEGLFRGDRGAEMKRVEFPSALLSSPGRVLLAEGERLWVGTVTGLVSIEGDTVVPALDTRDQPLGYVYTLESDTDGRIWAGTIGNGAWRQTTRGNFERVEAEGLHPQANVYSIAFGEGGLAALAQNDHIVLMESGRSRSISNARGDPVAAWDLVIDPSQPGHLWAGGLSGLVRYDLGTGDETLRLTASMGLGGEEFTTSRSLSRGREGELLCGLNTGLFSVGLQEALKERPSPEPKLVDVRWTGATVHLAGRGLVIEQGPWTLEATVAAPWFLDERSLEYRHRLVGFSAEWSPAEHRSAHQIRYTALPPGDYALEAQAGSPLVGWGSARELLRFRVRAAWWRRGWALTLWGTLLVAAVLLLAGWRSRALARRGRELEELVATRTQELNKALEAVEIQAGQDSLTGLPNRRSFRNAALKQRSYSLRHKAPFGFILLDLDHFKRINDTHGHTAGDEVLQAAARRLVEISRASDLVARYGGEEFIILAPNCSEVQLLRAAERLRHEISSRPFAIADASWIALTVSVGVSAWQGQDDTVDALFQRADRALYSAKETRNTVSAWHPGLDAGPSTPLDS